MRFLRLLRNFLALALGLVVLLALIALTPLGQTWLAERALGGAPGVQVSLKSVLAGLSKTEATGLRVEFAGGVLTFPTVEAGFPLKTALWDRRLLVGSLVAKGWTLDLTRHPAAGEADAEPTPPTTPVPPVLRAFGGLLGALAFPPDVTLDGVDLEGDVLVTQPDRKEPGKVHVIVKGGGLAAGRTGEFAVELAGPWVAGEPFAARGRLAIGLNAARGVDRLEYTGSLSSAHGLLPSDLTVTAGVAKPSGAGAESYTLDLASGSRHMLTIRASAAPGAKPTLEGTWKADARESDLPAALAGPRMAGFAGSGEGRFETDLALAKIHATGRIKTALNGLAALAPTLDRIGDVALEANFDLTRSGRALVVEQLTVAVAGARPIATLQAAQPFTIEEETGKVTARNPEADWLHGTLVGLPLAWLGAGAKGFGLDGGDLTGEFTAGAAAEGYVLQSAGSLVAQGVSLKHAGAVVAEKLDLAAALRVTTGGATGWQVRLAPLAVSRGGQKLGEVEVTLSPLAEPRRWLAATGTWKADLDALVAQRVLAGGGPVAGRAAEGKFSLRVGSVMDYQGEFQVTGHAAGHSLTAGGNGVFDGGGGVSFHLPITVRAGAESTDFSADGTWTREGARRRLEVELSGVKTDGRLLGAALAPLVKADGVSLSAIQTAWEKATNTAGVTRDARPAWGEVVGHVKVNFYQLSLGGQDLNQVAGLFTFAPDSLRLEGGRATVAPPPVTKAPAKYAPPKPETPPTKIAAEGVVSFDSAAESPYHAQGTFSVDLIDGTAWFATGSARDPLIEGRWAAAGTFSSEGLTLADLVARRREDLRLTSNGGVVRILKTDVNDAIPEVETPVKDSLAKVGSLMGALLGASEKLKPSGMNRVSKTADAVLEFLYQTVEYRYDKLSLTATRGADRAMALGDIVLESRDTHLTGTGRIGYEPDRPLRAQPLSLDLQLAFRGLPADKLTAAGLLPAAVEKDAAGYMLLRPTVHFGGTLGQVDATAWHELLAKAAALPPAKGNK